VGIWAFNVAVSGQGVAMRNKLAKLPKQKTPIAFDEVAKRNLRTPLDARKTPIKHVKAKA
jgi:hypothetical protein